MSESMKVTRASAPPRRVLLYSAASRDEVGGVQAVFGRLAEDLRRAGIPATEVWSGPGPARSLGHGVLVRPLLIEASGGVGRFAKMLVRAARDLAGLAFDMRRLKPAVINLHYVRGEALYFLFLRPWCRYRLLLSFHGSDLLRPSLLSRHLLPYYVRRADAITVVSRHLRDELVDRYGQKGRYLPPIHLIRNGIDLAFWAAPVPNAELVSVVRRPVVLFAGRLEPVKGPDVLLRGFAGAMRAVPGVRLKVIGDGSLREILKEQAADLELTPAVEWYGEVEPAELRRHLQTAAVFVLPSRSEGMPLALMEAMAAGCPCVAARVGGVPELLQAGGGLLVPPDDAEELEQALVRILNDPELGAKLGREARQQSIGFGALDTYAAYQRVLVNLSK